MSYPSAVTLDDEDGMSPLEHVIVSDGADMNVVKLLQSVTRKQYKIQTSVGSDGIIIDNQNSILINKSLEYAKENRTIGRAARVSE